MFDASYYTFSDPFYFEPLSRFPAGVEYRRTLEALIPEGWSVEKFDSWLRVTPEDPVLRPQGFKIHISGTTENAVEILQRVVPECVKEKAMFKVVARPRLLRFTNSKRYARSGSGKFVTIYPRDEECFPRLLEALSEATRDFEGPYILSDRRYGESKIVFYRYGGFRRIEKVRLDGSHETLIHRPDGELVPDNRVPYFSLPEWVEDPFPARRDPGDEEGRLLHGRYAVEEALGFTNTGGVYKALDHESGQTVVIKEARPYTVTWLGKDEGLDGVTALRLEHENLKTVQGLSFVPKLVELYQEWEHTFLVMEFVEGTLLANLRAQEDFILLVYLDRPERVADFCSRWQGIALQLLDCLRQLHQRGMIFGDLSPTNVLLNEETGGVHLIDFEGAYLQDRSVETPFAAQWFNPGFRRPDRRLREDLEPFDDYYAAGMLLYNLICPVQSLFELDKGHPKFRILDYFVASGLPAQTRQVIEALLEGDAAGARRELASWEPIPSHQEAADIHSRALTA